MRLIRGKYLFLVLVLLSSITTFAQFYGITDEVMGEYEGFWTTEKQTKGRLTAQIRPLSNGAYDGFILFHRFKTLVGAVKLSPVRENENNAIKFAGTVIQQRNQGELTARIEAHCQIKDGKLIGTLSGDLGEGKFEAKKTKRSSPTLGAKVPKRAYVLFDGKTNLFHSSWRILSNGVMQVGAGDARTTNQFTNFKLHVEFRTPYMPTAQGQARGNSGVYLQGKYEVQVLDSFGLYPLEKNDCGAIYNLEAPAGNACLPPMEWQTYDIIYVQGNAAQGELPNITVQHNGILIIDHVAIPKGMVEKGNGGGDEIGGFLKLQDHGNAVQYRNIWVEPFFSVEKRRGF